MGEQAVWEELLDDLCHCSQEEQVEVEVVLCQLEKAAEEDLKIVISSQVGLLQ